MAMQPLQIGSVSLACYPHTLACITSGLGLITFNLAPSAGDTTSE